MLSKLQKEILDKKDKRIVVMSAAGSGKTRIMTEKTRKLLRGGVVPSEIAVITFTNMAADELRQRLKNDYKDGIFIGTVHSLANYFLLSSGVDTSKVINDNKFDRLFELVKKNPNCIKPIKYILLDEAQDTTPEQFEFIFNMINPDNYFICADEKQCIYEYNGADPTLFMGLIEYDDAQCYSLNENYRNCPEILDFAKRIISKTGLYDDSIPIRQDYGTIHEVALSLKGITTTIKKRGNFKNWAILTRTNAELDEVADYFSNNNLPWTTFKQGDLTKEELVQRMEEDSVKILTIHSSKGLEWDNVVVIGARFYPNTERKVSYVAATRARNVLVWTTSPKKKNNLNNWE